MNTSRIARGLRRRPRSRGTLVAACEPHESDHHGEDVGETQDRFHRQHEIARLELAEESADRSEKGPQDENAPRAAEGHGVDDAESEQQPDLLNTHPVADVIEAIEQGGTDDGGDEAE